MSREYYIEKNGVATGPLTRHELLEQDLDENTLVWHKELAEWRAFYSLSELNPPNPQIIAREQGTKAPAESLPFRTTNKEELIFRGLARYVDFLIVYYLISFISSIFISKEPGSAPNISSYFYSQSFLLIATYLILIWLETIWLSRNGTTPGKKMLGISIESETKNLDSIFAKRSTICWILFIILTIPFLSFLLVPAVFLFLIKRQTMPWDKNKPYQLNKTPPKTKKIVLATIFICLHVFFTCFSIIVILLNALQKHFFLSCL